MRFADVARAVEGVPFMTGWQGRRVYDHLRASDVRDVLELGTAHGVSAAYMAAAVDENGGGKVTTVDRYHFAEPTPEETISRAGLSHALDLVRIDYSSYDWWLKDQIEARSDAAGNCEPAYDFCYLDGSHDWHIDGLAVILIERLLRPGAWLLMDDLNWTYEHSTVAEPPHLSDVERRAPHLRGVFDLILKPHPAFGEFRVEDDAWGWARKISRDPKRYKLDTTRTEHHINTKRLKVVAARALARLRRPLQRL